MQADNPFQAAVGADHGQVFVGREGLLTELEGRLKAEGAVLLVTGPPRSGRTALLRQLQHRHQGGDRAVYLSVSGLSASPERLMVNLARETLRSTGLPEASMPRLDGDLRERFLPQFLATLAPGASLTWLVDDIDCLEGELAAQGLEAFVSSLQLLVGSQARRLRCVISLGRKVGYLHKLPAGLEGLPRTHVTPLTRDETTSLLRISEPLGLSWPADAVDRVWELTRGQPWLIRQAAAHVWVRLRGPGAAPAFISPTMVLQALAWAFEVHEGYFDWLWSALPASARVMAGVLASAGSGPVSASGLASLMSRHGIQPGGEWLLEAAALLEAADALESSLTGSQVRPEMFRRWVNEFNPPETLRAELESLDGRAVHQLQEARAKVDKGQVEEALSLQRLAVERNPNHVGGALELVTLLTQHGRYEEARTRAETLFARQPAVGREPLVKVLLALAGTLPEAERLPLLDRVLEVDPQRTEARNQRQSLLKGAAERLEADGHLDQALTTYRQAELQPQVQRLQGELRRREMDEHVKILRAFEAQERYEEALEMARSLTNRYDDIREWNAERSRLEKVTQLLTDYHRAVKATEREERLNLLTRVVRAEPSFRDAALLLYETVSGVDVQGLQVEVANLEATRAALEAQGAGLQQALAEAVGQGGAYKRRAERLTMLSAALVTVIIGAGVLWAGGVVRPGAGDRDLVASRAGEPTAAGPTSPDGEADGNRLPAAQEKPKEKPESMAKAIPPDAGEAVAPPPKEGGSVLTPRAPAGAAVSAPGLGPNGFPVPRWSNSLGMAFVLVPRGRGTVGFAGGDVDEQPAHGVTFAAPFYIGRDEVSQAQWEALMSHNPSPERGLTLPVSNVTWSEAMEFITRLNAKEGVQAYRLPSEAEWEYAARGREGAKFPWGGQPPTCLRANVAGCGGRLVPVGSTPTGASPFGALDMVGNVAEWVADCAHAGFKGAPVDGRAWNEGCASPNKILKGNSFDGVLSPFLRASARAKVPPTLRNPGVGLRVVREAPRPRK